ncbi:hypothetical protein MHYP_G00172010 [Metynnis hypsauchen]
MWTSISTRHSLTVFSRSSARPCSTSHRDRCPHSGASLLSLRLPLRFIRLELLQEPRPALSTPTNRLRLGTASRAPSLREYLNNPKWLHCGKQVMVTQPEFINSAFNINIAAGVGGDLPLLTLF